MPFSSEEKESRCRGSAKQIYVHIYIYIYREEVEEGGAGAEKRTTWEAEVPAVRRHIGSDTSNPEATPQIPPSCWTSCSLHNRIRMNRPSPGLSPPSPSRLLVYTLLALFGPLPRLPSASCLRRLSCFPLLPPFHHTLLSPTFTLSFSRSLLPRDVFSRAPRMHLDSSFP